MRGDTEQWIFPDVVLSEEEKKMLIAAVVSIVTKSLFENHFYEFGGKKYHQKGGGPIGLRGTCAVARVIMQLFDIKWRERLNNLGITTWLLGRYMDDGRVFLPPIRHGWRMVGGDLLYCRRWAQEDVCLSAVEVTKRALAHTMQGIEAYLEFTMETCEDFEGGWLPTLDTSFRVNKANQVEFKHFEKETSSTMTIQSKSAMCENVKHQILSQDMVRRLYTTCGSQGAETLEQIVDKYAQKLRNGGYSVEQTQRIIINGIKGLERKKRRCEDEGRKLWRTAQESRSSRNIRKLTQKSNWFKKKKFGAEGSHERKPGPTKHNNKEQSKQIDKKTVLFVEQTARGELASKLKELMSRLAPILGFGVKIVERAGSTLKSQFPLSNLWEGAKCGRTECITCEQKAELELPKCTRSSAVYENVCRLCIKGAGADKELKDVDPNIPAIYVGETSRTILEMGQEHWAAWRNKNGDSHIRKHQELCHGGAEEPDFVLRAVGYYRTALSRQVAEAVRIRRRGGTGAVLNSKAEFNRSHIPRLQVEELNEEEVEAHEKAQSWETNKLFEQADLDWEQNKEVTREQEVRELRANLGKITKNTGSTKRSNETLDKSRKRVKKFKYEILGEQWGLLPNRGSTSTGIAPEQEVEQNVCSQPILVGIEEEPVPVLEPPDSSPPIPAREEQKKLVLPDVLELPELPPLPSPSMAVEMEQPSNGESSPPEQLATNIAFGGIGCTEEVTKFANREKLDDCVSSGRESTRTIVDVSEYSTSTPEHQEILEMNTETTVFTAPSTSTYGHNSEEKAESIDVTRPDVSEVCVFVGKRCETHDVVLETRKVTKKTWKDMGKGKGFGWNYSKVSKKFCNPRKRGLVGHHNSTNTNSEGRGDVGSMGLEGSRKDEISSAD